MRSRRPKKFESGFFVSQRPGPPGSAKPYFVFRMFTKLSTAAFDTGGCVVTFDGWPTYGPVFGDSCCWNSGAIENRSLSLMIGPPIQKPSCDCLNGDARR